MKREDAGEPDATIMEKHRDFARPAGDPTPIFYIGPFGSRVSFASQQTRALDIVGSLVQLGEITEKSDVVVVGAGLAGLTATAALHYLGAKVRLFEKGSRILKLQEASFHRYIHPTVNFWPMDAVRRTTALPFLDWYSSDCPTVVKAIRQQWHGYPKHGGPAPDLEEVPAIGGVLDKEIAFGWSLSFESYDSKRRVVVLNDPDRGSVRANVVLVAIGFGDEDTFGVPDQKRYWDVDDLDDLIGRKGPPIVISGAGDGGVIDCLRLVYKDFKNGDFALDVIAALAMGPRPLTAQFRTLEEAAKREPDPVKRAALLKRGYWKIIGDLNSPTRSLLEGALVPRSGAAFPRKIKIIARFGAPFELAAAPINRFLLAYALKKRAVTSIAGAVVKDGAGGFQIVASSGAVEPLDFNRMRLIVRHGPASALAGFLKTREAVDALRARQQDAGDFATGKHFEPDYFTPPDCGYPTLSRCPVIFARTRFPLALGYMKERNNLVIRINSQQSAPFFEIVGSAHVSEGSPDGPDHPPDELWGISVRRGKIPPLDSFDLPFSH